MKIRTVALAMLLAAVATVMGAAVASAAPASDESKIPSLLVSEAPDQAATSAVEQGGKARPVSPVYDVTSSSKAQPDDVLWPVSKV